MTNSDAKAPYEFTSWSRTVEKHLKGLLQCLPVWHGLDEYMDEQGLTEAFAPYERFEGNIEQTLRRLHSWVGTAKRYGKRLMRSAPYSAKQLFCVHSAPSWLELELAMEYYPSEASLEDMNGEAKGADFEPLPRYAPFGGMVAKVEVDQFCSYLTSDAGFNIEVDRHTGEQFRKDEPFYHVFEFFEWNSKVEGLLHTFLQQLKVIRNVNVDYNVSCDSFIQPNPDYFTVVGDPKVVVESLRTCLLTLTRYAQEAVADPTLPYLRYIYVARGDAHSLGLGIRLDYYSYLNGETIRNFIAECEVFRVGKHQFQIVADTESTCQKWLDEMRWVRSASSEELEAAGWITVDSLMGSFKTPGHPGATYYMAGDSGSAPDDSDEDPK